MRRLSLISLCILSACAGTSTLAPGVSQEELRREQEIQSGMVKAVGSGKGDKVVPVKPGQLDRLKRVAARISKGGQKVCAVMHGSAQACDYNFVLLKEGPLNAYADGKQVVVSPAMMDFAVSDDDLAVVLGHEFAHNILQHPQKQQNNAGIGGLLGTIADTALASYGYGTGGSLGKLGSQYGVMRYSQAFESEADYVGLYVIANAGVNVEKAPEFWRRFAVQVPDSIYAGSTHPTTAERFIAMEKTMLEIQFKQRNNQPVLPNLQPED